MVSELCQRWVMDMSSVEGGKRSNCQYSFQPWVMRGQT